MTTATNTSLGEIKLAGDLAGNNDGLAPALTSTAVTPGSYTIPVMTIDAKGRVTAASNATSATITALIPDASTTVKGIASISPTGGITVSSGVLSVLDATSSVKGVASFSSDFIVTSGNVALNPAALEVATGSVFGVVKSGTNITNTAGVLSIPDATSSVKGIASFNGTDFTVTAGAVALNLGVIATASGSTFGLVQTGTNITNVDGVISIPDATSSVKGVASFSSNFTVTAGNVVVNYANLTPNLTAATGSVFGVVKSGTNITNTSGVLSIPDATSSVKGVASYGSDFIVTSGAVSLVSGVARTNAQNNWSAAQSYSISALTYGATVTPNFALSNVFTLTATGNFTLANPTNVTAGTTYLIIITQDATGSRLITWGSNFKFGFGSVTALSTTPNKRDIISIVALTSSVLLVTLQLGF